tara:strand:- start:333 stop:500 length:168 start_codon:yes stop_codon:yes gene_type:complete
MKQKIDWRVLVAVISSITVLEAIALLQGINGTMFSVVLFILGALGGVTMPQLKTK